MVLGSDVGHEALNDRAEAVLWLPVVFLNWRMFFLSLRQKRGLIVAGWFLIMGLGTIVLAGEEISWGQHIFHWQTSSEMAKINAQQETNFHNLNLSLLMGLTPDDALYPYFKNANYLLNPAYYLATCILFIAIPIAKQRRMWRLLEYIPTHDFRIVLFFAANVVVYVILDQLVFDVGEVFEFSITTTFALVALDVYRRWPAASVAASAASSPRPARAATL